MDPQLTVSNKTRFSYLAPSLFVVACIIVFNLFQNQTIYNATLGKIGFTYFRINNPDGSRKEIIKERGVAFQKITKEKLTHWDAIAYYNLSKDVHRKGSPDRYAFFPMFPLLWKLLHIPLDYIIYFNILLFLIGFHFFLKIIREHIPKSETNFSIVALLLICLPSLVAFSIPYAEATGFIMFSFALFFMVKKNHIISFLFFILLAWCRPNTMMLLAASISALLLFIFKAKKISAAKPIVFTAIGGLLSGTILLFTYFYITSGDFWIFFEAQKHWGTQLQIPKLPFTDYSSEVTWINRILLFVFAPLAVFKLFHITFIQKTEMNIWLYVRFFSYCYFILTCLTVLFYQGGSLHSLHRYLLANPIGMIFIIDLCTSFIKRSTLQKSMIFVFFILVLGIIIHLYDKQFFVGLVLNKEDQIFINLGTFIFLSIPGLLFWMPQKKSKWNYAYYTIWVGLIILAVVWDSVLFNQFLSRGWLWA